MNYTILAYSIYLPAAIVLTIWVANQLLRNAKIFYVDIFQGQNEQALSLNKLIQVGFYLIGLGFAFMKLEIKAEFGDNNFGEAHPHYITGIQETMETLSTKIGSFVIVLGVMLFLNLILILAQRNKAIKPPAPTIFKSNVPETN
jgi:hypothetical protein